MTSRTDSALLHKANLFSRASALGCLALGVTVLVGWATDNPWLKALHPSLLSMKANTALGLAFGGAALALLASGRRGRAPALCAAVMGLLGALTLGEFLTGRDFGIDQLLFHEAPGAVATLIPGRMAPGTAACFTLMGTALAQAARTPPPLAAVRLPAFLAVLTAGLALLGYAFGVHEFQGLPNFTRIALHTAAGLVILGLGTLALDLGTGRIGILASSGPGGRLVRLLLPVALGIPLVLGGLEAAGEARQLYRPAFGTSLLTLATMVVLGLCVAAAGRSLDRADARRTATEAELAEAHLLLEAVLEGCSDPICALDSGLRLRAFNGAYDRMWQVRFGSPARPGICIPELLERRGEPNPPLMGIWRRTLSGESITTNLDVRNPDSPHRTFEIAFNPIQAPDGRPLGLVQVMRDVTERLRAEAEIRAAKEAAESSNKELEAFSYSVSHDLRAPLRHIDGFIVLLQKGTEDKLDERHKRYLTQVATSARRMGLLIDELLAYSRVGRTELRRTRVSLAALVEQVRPELEEEDRGPVLWEVGELPEVEADPNLLRLVVQNLLSNALKFTRHADPPRVEVGSRREGDEVEVWVRDNGAGFDMAYSDKLFGVFQRLHREDEFEGTGIGLAHAARIVRRHGGRIWAEGEPGRGATFHFTLPAEGR